MWILIVFSKQIIQYPEYQAPFRNTFVQLVIDPSLGIMPYNIIMAWRVQILEQINAIVVCSIQKFSSNSQLSRNADL